MNLTLAEQQTTNTSDIRRKRIFTTIRLWLCSWEIYPILLIASILRLTALHTTAFGGDQSVLYQLAYNAIHYGMLPVTSNNASIFNMHPPLAVYFLMLPLLFSTNPLWGAVMTALFNVVAVLLAYIFTRRYYGRVAATIAALLFATAQTAIVFSRFIWQPTLLSPFVLLFLFALFWGVVERRKGWLFPALVLLGIMYQLHEITIVMVALLIAALLLAPHTIRLRDIALALICLLILFAPYLVWQVHSNFSDIHTLFALTNAHASIDSKALVYYQRLLNAYYYDDRFLGSSYYDPVGTTSSVVFKLLPVLVLARYLLTFLLIAAFALIGILIISSSNSRDADAMNRVPRSSTPFFAPLYRWWVNLREDSFKGGLILLLLWQIVPVLALLRHSTTIHLHYLLMTLPGQFILIGFVLSRLISWLSLQKTSRFWQGLRYGTFTLTALLLVIQLAGSTASLADTIHGINNHIFGYNDIGSLQNAVQEADQVAKSHHLNRVYISFVANTDTFTAMPYLAQQMQTPSTIFDSSSCLVLPSSTQGPAVLLLRSTDTVALALLQHYTKATLIDRPPLLGTSPFLLYIVTPPMAPVSIHDGFTNQLQLVDGQAQHFTSGNTTLMTTRWTLLNNAQPSPFKTYTYIIRATPNLPNAHTTRSDCIFTAIRPGDQLITSFQLPSTAAQISSFHVTGQFLTNSPYTFTQGPLHFATFRSTSTLETLHTLGGNNTLTLTNATASSP